MEPVSQPQLLAFEDEATKLIMNPYSALAKNGSGRYDECHVAADCLYSLASRRMRPAAVPVPNLEVACHPEFEYSWSTMNHLSATV